MGEIWPGKPYPLGAEADARGTNFSVFSEVAERVELVLEDEAGNARRVDLPERTAHCWHGYVPGVGPGTRYGFRVHGPWAPGDGHWCNPAKLLLDPYARSIQGEVSWDPSLLPGREDGTPSPEDSSAHVPRSVVVATGGFDWGDDRPPRVPWTDTSILELHVKGFTARHPALPPELRGTYAGLAHPAALDHLQALGVTSVELMPVHAFVHDGQLLERGLRNYWGYNTIGFFAPHAGYAAARQPAAVIDEFRTMVRALHSRGIEVILDVVYNHTAEGNHLGPSLSFRGLDNAAYYRLVGDDRRMHMDYTGTGNSLNMRHPHVLQLLMDSLRHWVLEMRVDGFRFDLAATLARGLHEVDRLSAFFDLIQQDPVINRVKLIAEPWDVGEGGYQVGAFPPLWTEWNGRYRDCVRDFWRGEPGTLGEFASRLTGSSDLYEETGRKPYASINFVTCHDGFTLRDLVSYEGRHNEANGHDNSDGTDDNRAWNCGAEGETDDPAILALRRRQQRNLLATLVLSQGIPMLLGGDEIGRTQRGNNNAYCQDNELSWLDWEHVDEELLRFVRELLAFRARHPVLRRKGWFQGRPLRGSGVEDVAWFTPEATPMTQEDWATGHAKALAVFLDGATLPNRTSEGRPIRDDSLLLLFNGHKRPIDFTFPGVPWAKRWIEVFDTDEARFHDEGPARQAGGTWTLEGPALAVLRAVR